MRTALGLACLSYVLWRPVSNGAILYPVLALIAALALSKIVTGERTVYKYFALAGYLFFLAGLITTSVGSINGTRGLGQQATVWFGSFVIWGLWAVSLTQDKVRVTMNVLTLATASLSGLIVLYIGAQQGLLPNVLPDALLNAQGAQYDMTAQGSAIRLYGLSTLAVAGPLVSSALVGGRDTFLPSRKLLAVATFLAVLAAAIAGRRSIAAVTIVSPLLTYVLLRFLRPRSKVVRQRKLHFGWAVSSLWVAGLAFHYSLLDRPITAIADGLHLYLGIGHGSGDLQTLDDAVRAQQSQELLAAWGHHPLFGNGLGAVLPDGFIRSAARPWMFELQYPVLMFTSGLIGAGLVLAAFICGWIGVRRAAALNPEHVPVIVATSVAAVSMLVSNASDPYLQAVGHGWSIALVVGVSNALMRPADQTAAAPGRGRTLLTGFVWLRGRATRGGSAISPDAGSVQALKE